jgi:hypothetical protein
MVPGKTKVVQPGLDQANALAFVRFGVAYIRFTGVLVDELAQGEHVLLLRFRTR